MTTPRERAARALYDMEWRLEMDGRCEWEDARESWRQPYYKLADAVLDAIPAVGDDALGDRLRGLSHDKDDQREALREVIDAIKREEG